MQLFVDFFETIQEERDYLLQVCNSFKSSHEITFTGWEPQPPSLPENIQWQTFVPASLFSGLKQNKGYNDFIAKIIKANKDALWMTNLPGHIIPKIPNQVFIASNLEFLQHPQGFDKKKLTIKKLTGALQNAVKIITPSLHYQSILQNDFKIDESKIQVVFAKPSEITKPLPWEEKEVIKKKYTGGKEYFICCINDLKKFELIHLLKAFSIFKKWQQSSMQLVILHNEKAGAEGPFSKIETYKYKNDIVTANVEEREKLSLIAAAYSCLHPVIFENIPYTIINAAHCNVPVIATELPVIKEFAENAALYIPPKNTDILAQQMILLYKDEALKRRYVEKMKMQLASGTNS